MGPSAVSLPLRRARWPGHGFLAFVALALLALFAIQLLANTFRRQQDLDAIMSALEAGGHEPGHDYDQEKGEVCSWNICCPQPSSPSQPVADSTSAKPIMKAVRPLLAFAVDAWCSRLAPTTTTSSSQADALSSCAATEEWLGSSHLKYIFSFGDSFTTTWFNWHDQPPSPSHPLGNPGYPGITSATGANWIDLLTVKYNQSYLQTYNLAIGGAAVDQDIPLGVFPFFPSMPALPARPAPEFPPAKPAGSANPALAGQDMGQIAARDPVEPDRRSLKDQVLRDFITGYAYKNAPGCPDWNGGNALFTIWIGINDLVGSYARGPDGPEGTKVLNDRIFTSYKRVVDILYDHGARNFLFLNVPAMDRSPAMIERGPAQVKMLADDLTEWNERVARMARQLKSQHEDEVNTWVYDSRTSFGRALDDPTVFPETKELKNVTDICVPYASRW